MKPFLSITVVFFASLVACVDKRKVTTLDSKISLGRKLFFDKRLSVDQSVSCATCHQPNKAFTDGRQFARGVNNGMSLRNVPSLFNLSANKHFMFDGAVPSLEQQAIIPIQDASEMGSEMGEVIRSLKQVKSYNDAALKLYNRPFDAFVLTRSLALFQKSLTSTNSRFDAYLAGNKTAINKDELAGWNLFRGRLNCIACHQLPHFTNNSLEQNGLTFPKELDQGRFRISEKEEDKGFFKTPSLRNVAVTAPYLHNGRLITMDDVVLSYESKGEHTVFRSQKIPKFTLSVKERNQLVSFLKSLTDKRFEQITQ